MREFDAFAFAGEDDAMIADDVAATQDGKTDVAAPARAGDAVARRAWPTWSRLAPRPAAAARPSARAVPDGASTLWR